MEESMMGYLNYVYNAIDYVYSCSGVKLAAIAILADYNPKPHHADLGLTHSRFISLVFRLPFTVDF